MINSLNRCIIALVLSAIVFATTMFVPAIKNGKLADFLQGFSGGIGVVTLIGLIVLLLRRSQLQKTNR